MLVQCYEPVAVRQGSVFSPGVLAEGRGSVDATRLSFPSTRFDLRGVHGSEGGLDEADEGRAAFMRYVPRRGGRDG